MEKKKKRRIVWTAVVVLALAGVVGGVMVGCAPKEVQLNTRTATQGSIEVTVMATGYVQPVDKVDVGTQVSGVIEKIYVDFNSHVTKRQLLAELDKLTLQEKLGQANASLQSSLSDQLYAQQNFDRTEQLYNVDAATQVAYEEARNRLIQAQTSVANSQANLHQAQVNLSYAEIRSPIDGVVLDRAVEEGQTVAASFNTPTLFTIANDLTKMQVEADVDEADIGRVRTGQRVSFSVDAYPLDTFAGTVNQVRLQPVVTNNVVTYTVIIEAPNPDEKLFPGMTANIDIVTQSEEGIIVPVEALVFSMGDDVRKNLRIPSSEMESPDNAMREVWVREGDRLALRKLEVGINDGVYAVVTSGLSEGDEVVLSASMVKKTNKKGAAAANPLMPQGPRRR